MANDLFDERRVMPAATFRSRNSMSKSEYHRRRMRQRAGEPGSERLLPPIIRLSSRREGIRFCDEAAWQESQLVPVAPTGKRQRRAAEAR
jgi:hypothetical protein